MRRWWNELFRAGGWPWTGMEPDKEAGGGGSFEQMKENVSYDAAHKHHLFFFFFFFFQFFLQLLQLLLFVPFFSTSSYCRLFIFPLFSPTSWPPSALLLTMPPVRAHSFSPLFLFLLFAGVLFLYALFCSSFFPLFLFIFFFFLDHSILFLPSFIFIFFLSTSTYSSSIRASLRFSLLILVSRLLNLDDRCLHNNFPNKVEIVFGIWNGILWYARGSRINCYGIYVILINA